MIQIDDYGSRIEISDKRGLSIYEGPSLGAESLHDLLTRLGIEAEYNDCEGEADGDEDEGDLFDLLTRR